MKPRKSLGQNFLTDPNVARKIVGALRAPDGAAVVEIGPGTGALTGLLHERFPDLTALEVDDRAVALLRDRFPGLDVRHADVLATDWAALAREKGRPLYVIGNLPYYITSEILFGLLDARSHLAEAVVMMQLEVAQRLVAVPRTKAYGILSVAVQLAAAPELLFHVSKNVFYPKPDVTSAVVRLDFSQGDAAASGVDPALLRQVIRTAFNQRRKTLRNSLGRWTRDRGLTLPHGWGACRAEELEPGAFVVLARYLQEHA
ncbi:16S rRNA (adenine(1518)-N(6)/adenine(1519)-N(6))-dimethyltransferase RsmA [Rhodocaloribacter litoris]|uniref:16S rRNA (adenine(1518)-N(6)/adenine(1519)-N(6))- dimethyltransferase RsmA n=1 Tax=Rhodocaloribacter litoris TaxID=2558931 RepID=UPI001421EFD2|nr:16S rRNA (adenine(1518)-N(6)/adenine(1519)-N(6))-dimethyltransferase RsmA [Rhodocaloribacter litoris]QXD14146.1 16S rRNA (adenine(1518)-N(6)/adenine(1519)-N(6))-dimethyltransferase RsmA [Rhodocaloribacter litoris]